MHVCFVVYIYGAAQGVRPARFDITYLNNTVITVTEIELQARFFWQGQVQPKLQFYAPLRTGLNRSSKGLLHLERQYYPTQSTYPTRLAIIQGEMVTVTY